jgi:hypothetical protein
VARLDGLVETAWRAGDWGGAKDLRACIPASAFVKPVSAVRSAYRAARRRARAVASLCFYCGLIHRFVISGERADVARVTARQQGETLEIDTERRNNYVRARTPMLCAELVVLNLAKFVSEGVGTSTVSGFSGDKIALALYGAAAVTLAAITTMSMPGLAASAV